MKRNFNWCFLVGSESFLNGDPECFGWLESRTSNQEERFDSKTSNPNNPLPKNASAIADEYGFGYYAAYELGKAEKKSYGSETSFETPTVAYITEDRETTIVFKTDKDGFSTHVIWIPGEALERILSKLVSEGVTTKEDAVASLSNTVAPKVSLGLYERYPEFFYWLS